jgi:hypothetical protein
VSPAFPEWRKIVAGKFADAKPAVLVLALIFAVKFAMG